MLRQVIIPSKENPTISIPTEFYGKEVEILVFPVNKTSNFTESSGGDADEKQTKRQKAFQRFLKYCGKLPANFDYKKKKLSMH